MTAGVAMGVTVVGTYQFLIWFRRAVQSGLERRAAIKMAYSCGSVSILQTTVIAGLGLTLFALGTFVPTPAVRHHDVGPAPGRSGRQPGPAAGPAGRPVGPLPVPAHAGRSHRRRFRTRRRAHERRPRASRPPRSPPGPCTVHPAKDARRPWCVATARIRRRREASLTASPTARWLGPRSTGWRMAAVACCASCDSPATTFTGQAGSGRV